MSTATKSRITYDQQTVTSADGVVTFNITASFEVVPGDLPDGVTGVFVKYVPVPSDPKSDKFLRIATLADLGRVANTRQLSLDPVKFRPSGGTYITSRDEGPSFLYLSSVLTLAFDNLQVAIQAKAAMEQRVDALINAWRTFDTQYATVTATEFPLTDTALVTAAKTKLYTAITDYATARSAQKNAQSSFDTATASYNVITADLSRLKQIKDLVCPAVDELNTYATQRSTYFTGSSVGRAQLRSALATAAAYTTTASSYASVKTTVDTALTSEDVLYSSLDLARINSYSSAATKVSAACDALDGYVDQRTTDQNNAALAMTTATGALSTQQAVVIAKDAALVSAHNELKVVCPSYVASSDADLPEMGEWRTPILAKLGV